MRWTPSYAPLLQWYLTAGTLKQSTHRGSKDPKTRQTVTFCSLTMHWLASIKFTWRSSPGNPPARPQTKPESQPLRDWLGQHCLIREVDPSGLTAWSVKRVTAIELGEADQRRLQLTSLNPAYGPRELTVDASGDVGIEAVLREALSPNPARRERKKPPTENGQA